MKMKMRECFNVEVSKDAQKLLWEWSHKKVKGKEAQGQAVIRNKAMK